MTTFPWQRIARLAAFSVLVGVVITARQPISQAADKPAFTPEQRESLQLFQESGGIMMMLDEQRPGQPLILIDFSNHPEFQEDWLKQLQRFPELTTVRAAGTSLTDAGVAHLARLPKLTNLDLSNTSVTDAGAARLESCKQLRTLNVNGTRVTDAGIARLREKLPELKIAAKPATPASFTAKDIAQWREKLSQLGALPETTPNGWSKSPIEPASLLTVFPKLSLRKGFVLRAYVFKEDANSNGFVWALPADAAFPSASECPRVESHFLHPPKPFDALDDFMEIIEGDDSLESYLQASLLRRALKEFGGGWHGIKWGTHTVLDDDPWKDAPKTDDGPSLDRPGSKPDEWKWLAPKPKTWAPEVRRDQDRVVVTFYTYTPFGAERDNGELEKERIVQHTETYRRGKYRPLVVEQKIAEGPNVVVH